MNTRTLLTFAICSIFIQTVNAQEADVPPADPALLTNQHQFQLGSLSDPQVSPEGEWIAYTVTRQNLEEDKSLSRIWIVPAWGGEPVAMTAEEESSSHPRWSPDGRYLAYLSARNDGKTQVWSLFRQGGEAVQLTDTAQSVNTFEWSPDSDRMLLLLQDPKPEELAEKEEGENYKQKTPPPWVIDRQQFKTDYVGYLDRRRTHIYILDLETRDITQVTAGDYDDSQPAWSPQGDRIAFTSNRSEPDPDDNYNNDIWVVNADGSGSLVQVTTNPGNDDNPSWSPDGQSITHTSWTDVQAMLYGTAHLAVSSANGGQSRILTAELDRMISKPLFSPDGKKIWFILEDSGERNLARIGHSGGKIDRLVRGENIVTDFSFGADGTRAVLVSSPHQPSEIFQFAGGKLAQRTFTNADTLAGLNLGEVTRVRFNSRDGTEIEGFLVKPSGFIEGQRYPTILKIHGGPQGQFDYSFHFEAQLYAANGYLVVMPNPRGSTGYGQAFCLAIWQDWGGPDFEDVMAAVDDAIERGWADPERLGVTGWSYGGILTNHVITKTDRFKAATSGASETLYVVNYAHDQYQRWWYKEFGNPWEPEARALLESISPFNKLDKVVTPTLVLGGDKDWNVPIINSEQLYLALRRLGVETQLVVYPDEHHGNFKPTHRKDLYERYLNWFGERL
jgi:dipeptidyl aminopeptidase/acylaminoacyl peptidase